MEHIRDTRPKGFSSRNFTYVLEQKIGNSIFLLLIVILGRNPFL